MIKLAVTSGDPDGIGLEVSIKALIKIGPQPGFQYFLFHAGAESRPLTKALLTKWKIVSCASLADALSASETLDHRYIFEISNGIDSAPDWVVTAAKACLQKKLQGICTAPLSKTLIHKSGLKDHGHTEIFKRLAKTTEVNMGFVGKEFSVVLATDHIPIKKVAGAFTGQALKSAIKNAKTLRALLPKPQAGRPLAVLGLNPHAGENGILGTEEKMLKKIAFLPPDVAFLKKNWKKYSIFIAAYHDQGLIPFKLVHGQDSGVHISLGLPFVRTSVDHGTAKDLFGKNKANPQSMIEALQWGKRLTKLKQKES